MTRTAQPPAMMQAAETYFCLPFGQKAIAFCFRMDYNKATKEYMFPWPGIACEGYSAEQDNGVQVPALPAL